MCCICSNTCTCIRVSSFFFKTGGLVSSRKYPWSCIEEHLPRNPGYSFFQLLCKSACQKEMLVHLQSYPGGTSRHIPVSLSYFFFCVRNLHNRNICNYSICHFFSSTPQKATAISDSAGVGGQIARTAFPLHGVCITC